jgi:hypothetical protein
MGGWVGVSMSGAYEYNSTKRRQIQVLFPVLSLLTTDSKDLREADL